MEEPFRNEIPAGLVIMRVVLLNMPIDVPPLPTDLASNPTIRVPSVEYAPAAMSISAMSNVFFTWYLLRL
jgi:hypothetical protein